PHAQFSGSAGLSYGAETCAIPYENRCATASAKKLAISNSLFLATGLTFARVRFRRAPIRYLSAFLLICAGAFGILFSPSVGLHGGREVRSFTMNHVQEYP